MSRYSKYISLNAASIKALNKLTENDLLINGKKKSECQVGFYIDEALKLLAEKEGIDIA